MLNASDASSQNLTEKMIRDSNMYHTVPPKMEGVLPSSHLRAPGNRTKRLSNKYKGQLIARIGFFLKYPMNMLISFPMSNSKCSVISS